MTLDEVWIRLTTECGLTDEQAHATVNQAEATLPDGQANTGDELWSAIIVLYPDLSGEEPGGVPA